MIDTTQYTEIVKGYWYENATGKPWSNKSKKMIPHAGSLLIYVDTLKAIAPRKDEYFIVLHNGKPTCWHRLVWKHFKGNLNPKMDVDHKDNNPNNNLIDNLQVLSHKDNVRKKSKQCNNTSKYTGVSYSKQRRKYVAFISIDGKTHNLGGFQTPEEAYQVYLQAKIKYHGAGSIAPLQQ
jgi:hypothetical protein